MFSLTVDLMNSWVVCRSELATILNEATRDNATIWQHITVLNWQAKKVKMFSPRNRNEVLTQYLAVMWLATIDNLMVLKRYFCLWLCAMHGRIPTPTVVVLSLVRITHWCTVHLWLAEAAMHGRIPTVVALSLVRITHWCRSLIGEAAANEERHMVCLPRATTAIWSSRRICPRHLVDPGSIFKIVTKI